MNRISSISSFIIAGGKSKRFGEDKSLFRFKGKPLIEYVIHTLKDVFDEIGIIADEGDKFSYLKLPIYPDIIPGLGPIGGLLTALKHSQTERVFVVACDMPNLNADLIRYMASLPPDYDVIVPFINNFYEALHAIYSINCIDVIERTISSGRRQIISFFGDINLRGVTEEEISFYTDVDTIFENINYKRDVQHGD
jgi:molybdopterin-guanine dinucleotide biosynthesis protein A